jgi:hypothetical protein
MTLSASGLDLLRTADTLLQRGARSFQDIAAPPSDDPARRSPEQGAVDILTGSFLYKAGAALIRKDAELSGSLIDMLA